MSRYFSLRKGGIARRCALLFFFPQIPHFEECLDEVKQFEQERIEAIRQRLLSRMRNIAAT